MHKLSGYFLATAVSFAALPLAADTKPAQPNDFIEVFAKLFGEHKGIRKGHAKGVCAVGDFTASAEATARFDAALFSGATLPVTYRFSMAGGNPNVPDYARAPRGLAAQFNLPDGSKHNIATLTTPVFGAKDPENFLGLLQASVPGADGKPDMAKVQAFRTAHPDTQPQAQWLAVNPPPWSYTTAEYFGIHTFYLADKSGENIKIRWHLQPKDGIKGLTDAEVVQQNANFLNDRLNQRLKDGMVEFDWIISLGEASDSENDPSVQWPARPTLNAGTLRIKASGDASCNNINFDPNVLSRGFTASDDPVLRMRSPAYAISFGKRLSGQ
ncbi:catalase family peroxidase [Rheinheimera aquimaris]|uniref:Catalase-related peroxidase n=1 Tax=Rheinheimera aquimaris TaxID=412437 RepID=A0ABP3NIS9_9GAMM|nr:catalase family peroxidase [Rheinheimera aquimaris]MCB5213014.1 catalase family peroxidase [Rheinheimera aquimaris]